MRLDKYLCEVGLGTRSTVKKIIKSKYIKVNDLIVTDESLKINELTDIVTYKDELLKYQKFHYYMLNKPAGFVTSTKDKDKTVMDLIRESSIYDLSTVGRLDKDTEGLLIITNDGKMIHELTSPKKYIPKIYYVETLKMVNEEDIQKLSNGVMLDDGYITKKAKVEKHNLGIYLTIYEGKYHQVKRMLEAIDNKVTYLKRIQINNLPLDESLKLGEYKELSKEDLDKLRNI